MARSRLALALVVLGACAHGDAGRVSGETQDPGAAAELVIPEGLSTQFVWFFEEELCPLDDAFHCKSGIDREVMGYRRLDGPARARASELGRFIEASDLGHAAHVPAVLEAAGIHLRHRQPEVAIELLVPVVMHDAAANVDRELRLWAMVMLFDAHTVAVMQDGADRRERVQEHLELLWPEVEAMEPSRARAQLKRSMSTASFAAHEAHAASLMARGRRGDQDAYSECVEAYVAVYNDNADLTDAVAARLVSLAAECAAHAGKTGMFIQLNKVLVQSYTGTAEHADALWRLASSFDDVLYFEQARKYYALFAATYPKDGRVEEARRRLVTLSLMMPELSASDDGLLEGAMDEKGRRALDFRTGLSIATTIAKREQLARQLDQDGESLRAFIVRARLAESLYVESCPLASVGGLCVTQGPDGGPQELRPRSARRLTQAREQLRQARELQRQPGWKDDPYAAYGLPIAISEVEVEAADAKLALIEGDLGAEAALAQLPPLSYAPELVAVWRERRQAEIDEMVRAYGRIGAQHPGIAGAAAARSGLVFESDAVLLDEVSEQVAKRDPALSIELASLADERRLAAVEAYARGVELIADWGADVEHSGRACQEGLGRLLRQQSQPLHWVPEPDMMGLIEPARRR